MTQAPQEHEYSTNTLSREAPFAFGRIGGSRFKSVVWPGFFVKGTGTVGCWFLARFFASISAERARDGAELLLCEGAFPNLKPARYL
jgi:hypothetical protein